MYSCYVEDAEQNGEPVRLSTVAMIGRLKWIQVICEAGVDFCRNQPLEVLCYN